MKTSSIINLVLVFCLSCNVFAQEGNIILDFSGQDINTGNNLELESVYIKNVTQNCDTTVFGPDPSLNLSWPLAIDDLYATSGLFIEDCYPNPFLGSTNINISLDNNEIITIRLFNVYGTVVSEFKQFFNKGIHTFNISVSNSNIYYLSVSNGTTSHTQKLINQSSEGKNLVQIDYIGSEIYNGQFKSKAKISGFVFQPGDELEMQVYDSEYMGLTLYDNPNNDTAYNFDLSLIERKVLFEMFTGHKCVNCAEAELYVHELQEQYENQLSIISIHAGYYAWPDQSGPYTIDFSSQVGDVLHSSFAVVANPIAMINRMEYNNNPLLNQSDWLTVFESEISKSVEAFVLIDNNYNDQTRELNTSLEIKFLEEMDGDFKVCIFLTEDNNVAPQKNNNPDVGPVPDWTDYVHRDVLRSSLNGTWGEMIASGNITAGSMYTLQVNNFILDDDLKDEDCSIVAFLYNAETFEILQVAEKEIE